MIKTILIAFIFSILTASVIADSEAQLSEVESLYRKRKTKEARKLLSSVRIPSDRIDLEYRHWDLEFKLMGKISYNIERMIQEKDTDSSRAWVKRLWFAKMQLAFGKTNDAHQIYQSFTNRFACTPSVTNTPLWSWVHTACQYIETNKTVQQGCFTVPEGAAPQPTSVR